MMVRAKRMSKFAAAAIVVALGTLALSPAASAGIISVNFTPGDTTTGGGASNLDPTDSAGVVPATNWNNLNNLGSSVSLLNLMDDSGVATPADIASAYSGSGNDGPGVTGDSPDEDMLLTGRVARNGDVTLGLSEIPFDLYDIYVYVTDNNLEKGQSITVSDGSTTFLPDHADPRRNVLRRQRLRSVHVDRLPHEPDRELCQVFGPDGCFPEYRDQLPRQRARRTRGHSDRRSSRAGDAGASGPGRTGHVDPPEEVNAAPLTVAT